ncbi:MULTISPECIES: hypothetical protein [unclassified Mycobacterium]|uniref:hypothetical protein n=1 Tax=unclassified Mycobacterium TaxID=2642494 RepID=UPI0029C78052|nr:MULTISPECIES: hypothetical protein [unclassified Mycobacterium]
MGREALVNAEVGAEAGEVKALLETRELILRGEVRRRYPKDTLEGVRVEGDTLCFAVAGEAVRLHLGRKLAEAWAKAIATPPPSLRAKLGLDKGAKALLIGGFDDAALTEALDGALARDAAEAAMLVACIGGPAELDAARAAQAAAPALPVWTIYPKGKNVTFGDTAIRAAMRESGFRDTKSCAVSDQLTATRYHPA